MKRPVIVWVDDEEATRVIAQTLGSAGYVCEEHDCPVPSDDQLTRDIEGAISALEIEAAEERDKERMYRDSMPSRADKYAANAEVAQGMADRLRAAFDLDEGSDDA